MRKMTVAMVCYVHARRDWKDLTRRSLYVLVSVPPLLNILHNSYLLSFHMCKIQTLLLKSPCAFQSLRDANFGFRQADTKCGLGCEMVRQPCAASQWGISCVQPMNISLYLEKEMWKNCIPWHITLGLKRLFLKITQKSFCFETASCPDNCNAENNKQCLMDGEVAKCTCLPGYKQKDDGICQA